MNTYSLKGSLWHRWEPHIHVPGTILNDQFPKTANALAEFCDRIERAAPIIKAIGVTDYYSVSSYERLIQMKADGRLPHVDLIFPNIELRFKISTTTAKPINGHLLFSPEDPDHIEEIKRFLQKLTFSTGREDYSCQESDLIKLGRSHDSSAVSDRQALEVGTNQFKVDFDHLVLAYQKSDWAKENMLIAVAGGSNDGTPGLKGDHSFSETRQRIERSSHIVFSSNEKQRAFWIGKGVQTRDQIIENYNSCKPCLHGSDAHDLDTVGNPADNRYSWIKGDINFDSMRQACIEPEDRAFVGEKPPEDKLPAYVIDQVSVTNAIWMNPPVIDLNSGLITVIGARGSGKTALADLIAVGGFAITEQRGETSFIDRAYDHLTETAVSLAWQSGDATAQRISEIAMEDILDYPRVQYLSQKFVDQLCSSEGVTDRLILEIERVIFNAHPIEDKLGLSDFRELLGQKSASSRSERENQEELLANISDEITKEQAKRRNLPVVTKKRDDLQKEISNDKTARATLLSKDKDARLKDLADITAAFDTVKVKLDSAQSKLRTLNELTQDVSAARINTFPNYQSKLKTNRSGAGLSDQEWSLFNVDYTGDVDTLLGSKIAEAEKNVADLKGTKPVADPLRLNTLSYIPEGTIAASQTYEVIAAEVARIQALVGIDTENAKQYSRISEKILRSEGELARLNAEVDDSGKAQERIAEFVTSRKSAYKKIFEAILSEEQQLKDLYSPLMLNLQAQTGSLAKLSFVVHRRADVKKWAEDGELLLDLRKAGAFRGKGALLDAVNQELKSIWEHGNADEIAEALTSFRNNHEDHFLEHAQAERNDVTAFAAWAKKISTWLYSTDHISINYGVSYDNVDIQQLSPGTRGIVLLLLYLAIDREDDRPLIIDQPEENLDPKSIFDELVPLFKEAKKRRQIIIVTHNANLVVNTDADQVIVANAGAHDPGKLPLITYTGGGLENPQIRNLVCEILEGGKAAFLERAKRLRVAIQ